MPISETDARHDLEAKLAHHSFEEAQAVSADAATPSLFFWALKALGMGVEHFNTMTDDDLAERVASANPAVQTSLSLFAAFVTSHGKWAAAHFGIIVRFLIRHQVSRDTAKRLPVAPGRGTGGMPHKVTRMLRDMRQRHPQISRLVKAVRHALHGQLEGLGSPTSQAA